jgi:hypothetical protein
MFSKHKSHGKEIIMEKKHIYLVLEAHFDIFFVFLVNQNIDA